MPFFWLCLKINKIGEGIVLSQHSSDLSYVDIYHIIIPSSLLLSAYMRVSSGIVLCARA